jgi:hypothetical protein
MNRQDGIQKERQENRQTFGHIEGKEDRGTDKWIERNKARQTDGQNKRKEDTHEQMPW